jgi:hypothetical protein
MRRVTRIIYVPMNTSVTPALPKSSPSRPTGELHHEGVPLVSRRWEPDGVIADIPKDGVGTDIPKVGQPLFYEFSLPT